MKAISKNIRILTATLFCFCNSLSAQTDTLNKNKQDISPVQFNNVFSTSIIFAPVTTSYIYKRPTNELMAWPNFPLTTAQIEARDKRSAENQKLLPQIANQVVTSWINSKKQKPAILPRF